MELNDRIQKYIESLPPAVQGERGQTTLFEAALKLVVGFNLDAEQVAGYLWEFYNPRCVPPWDDSENADFIHQCEAAWKKAPAERGKFLESSGRSRTFTARSLSLARSQRLTAPALPLDGSQGADGSQRLTARPPSLARSQGTKPGPVRRFRLIRYEEKYGLDRYDYRFSVTWPDGSEKISIFKQIAPDCYFNPRPMWKKLEKEWAFVYHKPDFTDFMIWYRMDYKPDANGKRRKEFLPFHYVRYADGMGDFVEGAAPGGEVFPFGVGYFKRFENLIFTEGEKAAACVNRFLTEKGLDSEIWATCVPNGAGAWRDDLKEFFRGKTVFVWPDNDPNGTQYAADVCRSLEGVARSVRTLKEYPPGFTAHDDAVEVIEFYAKQRGKTDDADR